MEISTAPPSGSCQLPSEQPGRAGAAAGTPFSNSWKTFVLSQESCSGWASSPETFPCGCHAFPRRRRVGSSALLLGSSGLLAEGKAGVPAAVAGLKGTGRRRSSRPRRGGGRRREAPRGSPGRQMAARTRGSHLPLVPGRQRAGRGACAAAPRSVRRHEGGRRAGRWRWAAAKGAGGRGPC